MNKMLISATQANEVRVALVRDQVLYDLDVEQPGFEQKKANIYKGRVSRIEPSLEAAFIDYGSERHGFLPFKDIARSYFKPEVAGESFSRLSIKDALQEGQEVVVQIDKEERGNKGAALTTFISLAGSYLVLMPNNPRVGGVSRRIEGKERDEMKDLLHNLNLPEGMGLIVRTAGMGKSLSELKWDLDSLMRRWEAIETAAKEKAPFLIYQEGDAVMRAIRDYLRQDMAEIMVDSSELLEKTKKYIEQVKPEFIDKIKLYESKVPLFSFYQIEKQIETAYQRVVRLPSGGSISIDHTEALVSVDVNSSKATSGGDIEETARNTNIEAAEEVARQLRLRDIGGLIVIDFIDMSQTKNQREVSHKLRDALEHDRARVQVGHITRFGLLEMSRQRLRSHLGESIQVPCPRCDGQGTIRSIESLASSIIRVIEEEAIKEHTAQIQIQLPVDLATFIINERRDEIVDISKRQEIEIKVLPNQKLDTPQYNITRVRNNEAFKNKGPSYKIIESQETKAPESKKDSYPSITPQSAAVSSTKLAAGKSGIFGKIKLFFKNLFKSSSDNKKSNSTKSSTRSNYSSTKRGPYRSNTRNKSTASRNTKRYRRPNSSSSSTSASSPASASSSTSASKTASASSSTSSGSSSTDNKNRRRTGDYKNTRRTQNSRKPSSARKPTPPPSDAYPEISPERVKEDSTLKQNTPPTEITNELPKTPSLPPESKVTVINKVETSSQPEQSNNESSHKSTNIESEGSKD